MFLREKRKDIFILWSNSLNNEKEILIEINNNFKILKLIRKKYLFLILNLFKLYKFSFVPFYFLIKKVNYLRKYPKNYLIVIVENINPEITHEFNGFFRTFYCKKIFEMKSYIRKKYGKISDEHVIHSADLPCETNNILNLINYKEEINKDIRLKYIKKIDLSSLLYSEVIGSIWSFRNKSKPIIESPHLSFLNGNINNYLKYKEKFRGTAFKDYYDEQKFRELFKNISENRKINNKIKVKLLNNNNYLILDGLHRAAIMLYLNKKLIEAEIYE